MDIWQRGNDVVPYMTVFNKVLLCTDVQLAAVQEAPLVRNRDEDGIPLLLL